MSYVVINNAVLKYFRVVNSTKNDHNHLSPRLLTFPIGSILYCIMDSGSLTRVHTIFYGGRTRPDAQPWSTFSSPKIIIMASLDKSLDDIIASSKRGKKFNVKKGKSIVKRPVGQLAKPGLKPKTLAKLNNARVNNDKPNLLDGSYATKVVVYGLPKDIKQDAIKVCI